MENRNTGFTLVELSIVLIVIGLLVGGILAAQSMVKTAQITKVIRQLQSYDIAVANFGTKFNNQIPGDSSFFNGIWGTKGDNDRIVVGVAWNEASAFWNHLSLGVGLKNFKGGNYGYYYAYDTNFTEEQCPRLKIDQNKRDKSCLTGVSQGGPSSAVVYRYMAGAPGFSPSYPSLKPLDMFSIDKKLDDGNAISGNMKNTRWGSESAAGSPECNDVSGNYLVNNSYACTLTMRIGTITGNPDMRDI